jgi:fumarate reductase flavoprotein subunit
MDKINAGITRRQFIKGTAAAAGVAAVAGTVALSGCASTEKTAKPVKVDKTFSSDLVIVGCGISGIVCAAAAAMKGAKVIGIERQAQIGGNGAATEGMWAFNSPQQRRMGINVKKSDVMKSVLSSSQWVADGALWDTFIDATGQNIQWLMDQGVAFDDPIDGGGIMTYPGIHLFSGEGVRSAGGTLLPKMIKIAEDKGTQWITDTRFTSLITGASGKVTGCYATNAAGETLQFNAKAVILATGSFAGDEELMNLCGFNVDGLDVKNYRLSQFNTGDGIKAAVAQCNAKTMVEHAAWNAFNEIGALNRWNMFCFYAVTKPSECVFINQDGLRFIAEDYADANEEFAAVPGLTQKQIFSIFDRAAVERWQKYPVLQHPPLYKGFTLGDVDNEFTKDPALSVGNSLDEVARKAGVDPALLQKTVARYNELAARKEDLDFGKAKEKLFALSKAPYYIAKINVRPYVMLGGLYTDNNMRVLDSKKKVIEGLYAIGTDGCMLFRTYYAYNYCCAGANAHNIFSARVAAEHACSKL